MNGRNKKTIKPWRMAAGVLSIGVILFLWVKKDVAAIYSTLPPEQLVPVLVTTVAVSLLKIAAMVGAAWLIKWIVGNIRKK